MSNEYGIRATAPAASGSVAYVQVDSTNADIFAVSSTGTTGSTGLIPATKNSLIFCKFPTPTTGTKDWYYLGEHFGTGRPETNQNVGFRLYKDTTPESININNTSEGAANTRTHVKWPLPVPQTPGTILDGSGQSYQYTPFGQPTADSASGVDYAVMSSEVVFTGLSEGYGLLIKDEFGNTKFDSRLFTNFGLTVEEFNFPESLTGGAGSLNVTDASDTSKICDLNKYISMNWTTRYDNSRFKQIGTKWIAVCNNWRYGGVYPARTGYYAGAWRAYHQAAVNDSSNPRDWTREFVTIQSTIVVGKEI